MILSDRTIKKLSQKGLIVNKFRELYTGPNSVDMHLLGESKILKQDVIIDCKENNDDKFVSINFDELVLYPGKFYILSTEEILDLPDDITAFVQGRSSLARTGISVHAAGFVDSGFKGTITLEVTNMTSVPIKIYKGMRICQIVFAKADKKSLIPYGKKKDAKYQNQMKPGLSKINTEL